MGEEVKSFIRRLQIKRLALLGFMCFLTWDVYQFTEDLIHHYVVEQDGELTQWMILSLLGPISAIFPLVINFMKEDK